MRSDADFDADAINADAPPPIPFEGRPVARASARQGATLFVLDASAFGMIHEVAVDTIDADGLIAACDEPLRIGAEVSIGFARPDQLARRGVVTACRPSDGGCQLTVRFLGRLAA